MIERAVGPTEEVGEIGSGRHLADPEAGGHGHRFAAGFDAAEVFKGMAAAASRYGVPIVGGHSNARADQAQLAVAILGRATRLLSSFAARPGQRLLMAVDLRGAFVEPYPYWNASTEAPAQRLRGDLEILPALAEDGLCAAAKDISMAGTLGTEMTESGTVDLGEYGTGTWTVYTGGEAAGVDTALVTSIAKTSVAVSGPDQDTAVALAELLLTAEDGGSGSGDG